MLKFFILILFVNAYRFRQKKLGEMFLFLFQLLILIFSLVYNTQVVIVMYDEIMSIE